MVIQKSNELKKESGQKIYKAYEKKKTLRIELPSSNK